MTQRIAQLLRGRSGQNGFIIVAVLWILAALATLTTIFSMYVINTATAFTVHDERLQAEGLARAAIELSVYQVASTPQTQQTAPSRGTFLFRVGNAEVNAEFNAETARIDLNAAPKELIAGLFVTLGAQRGQADYYADRIAGWRNPPSQENSEAEAGLYRAAGLTYGPRGAPFQHIGELSLVLGVPDVLIERASPFLTVYSGQPQINIFNAAPQAVAALPGMDPQRLQAVLVQREARQQNAQGLLAMLGAAQTLANTQSSKSLRVTARIAFDSGQRMTTEAVIFLLDNGTEPYRILTWRDDMDDTGARVAR